MNRAEIAADRKDDALFRAAIERSKTYKSMCVTFRQQVEEQKTQVEKLKHALLKLQHKLGEAQSKSDTLIALHRRSRGRDRFPEAEFPHTFVKSTDSPNDFTIAFSSELSPEQLRDTLFALAEYYRRCGGVGLRIEDELQAVIAVIKEPIRV
jgi:hypothetical protein